MKKFLIKQKRRIVRAYYKRKTKFLWEAQEIPCPLCGNNDSFTTLWNVDRYGLPITTVRCDTCSLVFTRPFPTENFLSTFYSTCMFRGLDWGVLKVSKKLAREFGAPERAKKHVVFMQALLNKGIISQGDFQSILDIGSSEGSFLLECKSVFKHIKTYGVEPGKNFRFLTQKLFTKVFSSVEEIPEKQTFDCITMWHVLEHVSDPNKTMKEVASRMSENSLFIFEVPDETRYNGIRPIHVDHTYHYSEETLKKFLQKAGLQFVESSHEPQFLMDNIYGIKIVARKS